MAVLLFRCWDSGLIRFLLRVYRMGGEVNLDSQFLQATGVFLQRCVLL